MGIMLELFWVFIPFIWYQAKYLLYIYIYIYIYIILKNLCPDIKLPKMFQTKRNQIVLVPFPVP